MSDNDLIGARDEILRTLNYINSSGRLDYEDYCELFDTINREFLALLKQSRRRMSAVEYVDALERLFGEDHDVYSAWYELMLSNEGDARENRHKAVAIVEKWAREHPEEVQDE